MEANEITCPQCGLANNGLAASCVQCGIIFIKHPEVSLQTMQGDHKRKAIEEAEAMLDDTQAPPEIDAPKNEIIQRPDPREDTVEMQIPKEETTDIKSETAVAEEPKTAVPEESKSEDNEDSENQEIELEAIEAAMEGVGGTADAEAVFLSEVDSAKSSKTATPETAQNTDRKPAVPDKANDKAAETPETKADKEDHLSSKAEVPLVDSPPDGDPMAEPQKEGSFAEKASAETKSEKADTAETETAVTEIVEPAKPEGNTISANTEQPEDQVIQIEEKPDSKIAEAAETQTEASSLANATIEMPKELVESQARADEEAQKAKQDALKKQQAAQAKAEILEKKKAAQAVAIKKKKLAQAQALKKQKAAQAKAEALKKKKEALVKARASKKQEAIQARADALKKQKAAQALAEASSREVQHVSAGVTAAAGAINHYARLLGLLKRYKGKAIGINYDNSSELREAELVEANEEFFSVRVKDKKLQYSYPLKTILTIVEGQEGVETGEGDKKAKFDAVIKVYPLVLF